MLNALFHRTQIYFRQRALKAKEYLLHLSLSVPFPRFNCDDSNATRHSRLGYLIFKILQNHQ